MKYRIGKLNRDRETSTSIESNELEQLLELRAATSLKIKLKGHEFIVPKEYHELSRKIRNSRLLKIIKEGILRLRKSILRCNQD